MKPNSGQASMSLKLGAQSYTVVWNGKRIEYWEYVLRTIRTRHGTPYGYWWCKIPGLTWGKLSPKHGDYGWLPTAPTEFRLMTRVEKGRPYAASKLGALRLEIAELREEIREHGADSRYFEDEATVGEKLPIALKAQKRLRSDRPAKEIASTDQATPT